MVREGVQGYSSTVFLFCQGNATVGNSLAWTWSGSISVEKKINQQINAELFAHYNYVSMVRRLEEKAWEREENGKIQKIMEGEKS